VCQLFAEHRWGRSLPRQTQKEKDKRKVGCYDDKWAIFDSYLETIYTLLDVRIRLNLRKGGIIMARGKRRTTKGNIPPREIRRWALLVYIAGDNNLTDAGLEDIQEMCDEGSSSDLHIGVEIDTYGEHTGSIRYEITEPDWTGTAHRKVIMRLPEKDSGDPATLQSFVEWGLDRYEAENRLLVVWNHGAGFRSPRRDIGYDDFGSSLDMPEIERALQRAGITNSNRLQIIGFDACLMNMVEIVHHFASQVEIIVGSQQTEPGDGWPYDKVLKQAKDAKTPDDLAKAIVKEYIADYKKIGVNNVTQSAVRTADTQAVIDALDTLGNALLSRFNKIEAKLRAIRMASQTFQMADYVDLIHVAEQIRRRIKDSVVADAAVSVITSAEASIISNGKYGSTVSNANGLSFWFPASEWDYFGNRAKYMELKCNSSHFGWRAFLDLYHQ